MLNNVYDFVGYVACFENETWGEFFCINIATNNVWLKPSNLLLHRSPYCLHFYYYFVYFHTTGFIIAIYLDYKNFIFFLFARSKFPTANLL